VSPGGREDVTPGAPEPSVRGQCCHDEWGGCAAQRHLEISYAFIDLSDEVDKIVTVPLSPHEEVKVHSEVGFAFAYFPRNYSAGFGAVPLEGEGRR